MKLEPFRIEPEFVPRIWGARLLDPLFPERSNLQVPIGEAWLSGMACRIATGPFAGHKLSAAWEEMSPDWRGARLAAFKEFPILVKFIFPNDKLSIQVHPDDAYAAAHEQAAGGQGKTEMWHVIAADPGAQVRIGLKPGVDKQKFREALSAGTLEELLESWPVHAGDSFFVPAGTPHTIGPGMILCEVQEYSDLTYRVYDYGRVNAQGQPRELHIEKALAVMHFGRSNGGKTLAMPLRARGAQSVLLAACPYFAAERWEFAASAEMETNPEHFDVLVILGGSGDFLQDGSLAAYQRGETWFVPAALGTLRLAPRENTVLLRAYVPDLAALKENLRREGANETMIARVIFD